MGLRQLAVLSLHGNMVGGVLEVVLDSPLAGTLTELDVRENLIGQTGAELLTALARSRLAGRLTRLGLGYTEIDLATVAALAGGPPLPRLAELDLAGNNLDDVAMQVLADWPGLQSIRSLDLSDNAFGSDGVRALAASEHLDNLECLDLRDTFLDNDTLRALIHAPRLYGLRRLRLSMQARVTCHPQVVQQLRGRFGYALDWQ